MPTTPNRTSLTDGMSFKKPAAKPAAGPTSKVKIFAIVGAFLLLGLGVAYMYYEPAPKPSDYEPPPEPAPAPGAKPVKPYEPPPIPPPAPGARPTITG